VVCLGQRLSQPRPRSYLHRRFEVVQFSEHFMRMRYLPFFRVPYYLFIGRKPDPKKPAMQWKAVPV